MNKRTSLFVVLAMALLAGPVISQVKQASTGGNSPHETTSAVIAGNRVTLSYGRPFSRDPKTGEMRVVWGKLVPWDKAWRMGSDEATTLITQQPLAIGETTIPAGAYTLYMVPSATGTSKLAFSKKLGGWGIPVDETMDLVRVDVVKGAALDKSVDQFTMMVDKDAATGGGAIKWMWETTQYSVPFTIKK